MEKYLKVMEDVVKPWMDRVPLHLPAGQCTYKIKQAQECLKANLPEVWEKEIWSSSLLDCNPLDYYTVCGALLNYNLMKSPPPPSPKLQHLLTPCLISKMKEAMGSLNRDTIARAFKLFWSRLEAVVEADGNFIE
jgi:hypothetical protein